LGLHPTKALLPERRDRCSVEIAGPRITVHGMKPDYAGAVQQQPQRGRPHGQGSEFPFFRKNKDHALPGNRARSGKELVEVRGQGLGRPRWRPVRARHHGHRVRPKSLSGVAYRRERP